MPEVLMPRLSDATTEATIVAWLVPDGTVVRIGDEVVEIETDKATTAWPADADGVLSIAVPAGQTVCPGTAIARIGESTGGATPSANGASATDGTSATSSADGASAKGAATNGASPNGTAAPAGAPPSPSATAKNGAAKQNGAATKSPAASDATAAVAGSAGQNGASARNGSGSPTPGASDTPAPAASAGPAPAGAPAPAAPADTPTGADLDDRASVLRTPSRIERLVSDRMVESRTQIPEFTVSVEIDMAAALAMRGDLKAVGAPGGGGRTPSINDLFVKACALALVDHPRVRSAWTDDGVLQHERIDVGVAVATDDGGLVVPVVRSADRIGLAALAAATRDLTGRARKGRITPAEMSGATFAISNLGAMGVSHFTAIIGPGQGAILAVGATIDRYVPVDGQPVLRPICTVTLSSDHRVIYGAHAAAFLERLRTILEHPGALAF